MNPFFRRYVLTGFVAFTLCHSMAFAVGLSDSSGGQRIASYTIGTNPSGTSDVWIYPAAGKTFEDPAGCAGTTSPTAIIRYTGDEAFRLLLVQLMAATATAQKLTLVLDASCYPIGWGAKRPIVVGIKAYVD